VYCLPECGAGTNASGATHGDDGPGKYFQRHTIAPHPLAMLRTLKEMGHRLLHGRPTEMARLLAEANRFPRHTPCTFRYKHLSLQVTDMLSVVWQLMELFEEERLRFRAGREDPLVIDVGANVGVSALYFHRLYPRARIICFEPDPALFACLRANLEANGAGHVECRQQAAWTHGHGVAFNSDGADGGAVQEGTGQPIVPSARLKDVLTAHPAIDLLKVDIEGAECTVLPDCADELVRVEHLYVEYHSFADQPQRLHELLAMLTAKGFRYDVDRLGARHGSPFVAVRDGRMDLQLDIHAVRGGWSR